MATKPKYPFVRPLAPGAAKGTDIQAVKRALSRVGLLPWGNFDDAYNHAAQEAVKKFQHSHGLEATGKYGKATHLKLVAAKATADHPGESAFDAYAGELLWAEYEKRQEDPALAKAKQLLAVCRKFTGPYVYGGGHGVPLAHVMYSQGLDCSSSTCKALFDVDLFDGPYATNSAGMESWGAAGRGRYVTVHANWEHVWVEFTPSPAWGWCRFDTSPHGCGSRGPRVRTCRRFDASFVHRHPKGL